MVNKVKFNIRNVHYAPLSFSGTTPVYEQPIPIPGAVSLYLNAKSDVQAFYSNGIYYSVSYSQGYEGELEIAMVPESFRRYALDETLDTNKVLAEGADIRQKPFALLFEFDGDKARIRHVLYNCIAQRPGIKGKTASENREIDTETLSVTASPLPGGVVKAKTGDGIKAATYNSWFSSVYLASGSTAQNFTAFTIDGVAFHGLCDIKRMSKIESSDISGLMLDKNYFNDVYGTYMQYDIEISLPVYDKNHYNDIYELLTKPAPFHSFVMDYGSGTVSLTGRVEEVKDRFVRIRGGAGYWDGLSFTIYASAPTKVMNLSESIAYGLTPLPADISAAIGDLYEYTQSGWVYRDYADASDTYY